MELFCFLLVPEIRLRVHFLHNVRIWVQFAQTCLLGYMISIGEVLGNHSTRYTLKGGGGGIADIQTILWTNLSSLMKWAVICVKVWLPFCPTFYVRHSFKMSKSKQRACSSVLREFRTSLLFRTRRRRKKSQNKVGAERCIGVESQTSGGKEAHWPHCWNVCPSVWGEGRFA